MTKKEHRMYVIFDVLINKIGKQNFTVEEKDLINYCSKGYFFDTDEDTMMYKSVVDMFAKEGLARKSMTKEPTTKEEAYAIKEATGEPFPECLGSELQYCGDCNCVYSNVCYKRILEKSRW